MNITKSSHFERVLREAKPGETVLVEPGVYNLNEVYLDRRKGHGGKPDNPLHIKANGDVTLVGLSRRFIIWANHVIVEGFHFKNWNIDIFGTGNTVIDNSYEGKQPKYGFIECGGRDVLIDNNDIQISGGAGNTRDHGIYLHAGRNIVCRENKIDGASGYGIHLYDEHKSQNPVEPMNMVGYLIENNVISGSRTRSGMIVAKGTNRGVVNLRDIVIQKNIFRNNNDAGLIIRHGKDISVIDNEFYDDNLVALVPITREGNTFNGNGEPPNTEPPVDEPPVGDPPPRDGEPTNEGIIVVEDEKFKVTVERK